MNYVPKDLNPTEVPQCRPIEDFFKVLASHFYRKNWLAESTEALMKRIRKSVERIPAETVLATTQAVRKKLLRAMVMCSKLFREHVCFISNVKMSKLCLFIAIMNLVQIFMHRPLYTQLDSKPLSEVHIVVNFHFNRCLAQQPSK